MNTHMLSHVLSHAARLSDQDLVARVKRLARQEREATATLIAHLAILDERRLYLAEGCSSLFMYCTQVLHLSEHAAYGRIAAARAARRFPTILDRLAEGSVNLTTVCLLAPHLTAHNHAAVLDEARHKSKRQVEELVTRLHPRPPVPSTIRQLPMLRHETATAPCTEQGAPAGHGGPEEREASARASADGLLALDAVPALSTAVASSEMPASSSALPVSLPPARRPVVEPLAPRQYRVQFTADAGTHEKLRRAQALLRHRIPDGDLARSSTWL